MTLDTILAARERLAALDCDWLETAILQPAEPFLDLAGEELRARIFLTDDGAGRLMCLRPEFTIPAARHWLAHGGKPARLGCAGTVFRQRAGEVSEFRQAGIEAIGDEDAAKADARAISDAHALIGSLAPDARLSTVLGDQAIFDAVTRALGLHEAWSRRLSRLFGDETRLAHALDGLRGHSASGEAPEVALGAAHALPPRVATALADADDAATNALVEAVRAEIDAARMGAGARDADEIAARLVAARTLAGQRLGEAEGETLRAFLALDVALPEVERAVRGLDLPDANGRLDAALDAHARRLDALSAHGLDPASIRFRGAFGRSLDYYTGLVFEVRDGERVLAGGGRYDRLLSLLGAPEPVPAVGFVAWLDRLEERR